MAFVLLIVAGFAFVFAFVGLTLFTWASRRMLYEEGIVDCAAIALCPWPFAAPAAVRSFVRDPRCLWVGVVYAGYMLRGIDMADLVPETQRRSIAADYRRGHDAKFRAAWRELRSEVPVLRQPEVDARPQG